ncbi:MAG: response regulator transcription factor [Acidobacteria bacterium]|nr:response regulator transcription factor [Acidobacteriota bacterium]
MSRIHVLIVDDHAILRAGLRMLISAQPDMDVVDEAGNGQEAMQKTQALKPDVVLLDITMPGINGLKAIEEILQICPKTKVLVLTMHEDPAYLKSALAAGSLGYVVKRAADSELLAAIRTVYRGKVFIDRTLGDDLIQDLLGKKNTDTDKNTDAFHHLLSQREREVLQLLAQGYTNQQVAASLSVSIKTAETYRARVFQKLGFRDRVDLVRYAVEIGILTPDKLS